MHISKINDLGRVNSNIIQLRKADKSNTFSTNTINSGNINALNFGNKSLISFNGYYETLQENYFNLPINKETGKPFEPDIYQKAAAENLYKGNDVVVTAPTGTGKTAIAHYIISKNLKEGKKTFYTTPLKALSNDKVREFQKIYGKDNVGLITGDKKINKDAPIVIMTTEVYRNMVVQSNMREKNPLLEDVNTVVFDELHYLGDVDRGSVWEQSIIFTDPKVQLLSLSGTMANPGKIADWMASIKGQPTSEKVTPDEKYRAKDTGVHTVLINVPAEKRHVPLDYEILNVQAYEPKGKTNGKKGGVKFKHNQDMPFAQSDNAEPSRASYNDVVKKLKSEDKLPAIFFVFSKREGKSIAHYLSENGKKLTTDEETEKIEEKLNEYRVLGKYLGESLDIQALKNGYAVHNAGMLPEQKELIEELFQQKLIKVVISTETLSAGINMPARTTVISALRKPTDTPDGLDHKRYITPNEFHQMAGRAGRRGIDKKGYCYSLATNKSQRAKYEDLIKTPSNDITSHFNIDYSFVATANDAFRDKAQLKQIFRNSLQAYDKNPDKRFQNAKEMTAEFMRKEKILKDFGYLDKENIPTLKGQMLSHLNGYAQIPVIDSIASGELFGLSPVQLAGYVAGLANLDCAPRSIDKGRNQQQTELYLDDDLVYGLVEKFDRKKGVYDYNLYRPLGKELKYNKDAIEHIYAWADKNNRFDDSTKNWRYMYYEYIKDSRMDEGKLFKEIMMTIDLLKQMDEIAQIGAKLSEKENYVKYYNNLSDTIKASIELLNQPPTMTSDPVE